jgi:3'(2'), 5'-bisphosphate nucleotidase
MQKELDAATELAVSAGQLLLKHYEPSPEVEWKESGDPVTQADRLASGFLVRALRSRFPNDAIVSEEESDDPDRCRKSRVWIIDPMDGTREFIEHRSEFSVMIGLAMEGAPVLGVIYHPVAEKLYYAAPGSGASLKAHGEVTSLRVSPESDPRRMTIAVSRSHHSPAIDSVCTRLQITRSIRSGSIGLKVGIICEGRAHLYLDMSGRTSLWDTCAPTALLHEAGGRMTDLKGMHLRYDTPGIRNRNGIIASNGTIHDRIVEAVNYA